MFPHGYEEIDHTADLAMKVWGEDLQTLLRQAAKGLYELMGVKIDPDSSVQDEFSIGAGSEEIILVDFLNEVLFLAEDKRLHFDDFIFAETSQALLVSAAGHSVASLTREVKAATFHDLAIRRTAEGMETTLTFDI